MYLAFTLFPLSCLLIFPFLSATLTACAGTVHERAARNIRRDQLFPARPNIALAVGEGEKAERENCGERKEGGREKRKLRAHNRMQACTHKYHVLAFLIVLISAFLESHTSPRNCSGVCLHLNGRAWTASSSPRANEALTVSVAAPTYYTTIPSFYHFCALYNFDAHPADIPTRPVN